MTEEIVGFDEARLLVRRKRPLVQILEGGATNDISPLARPVALHRMDRSRLENRSHALPLTLLIEMRDSPAVFMGMCTRWRRR